MSDDVCLGCRVGFHQECNDPQPHVNIALEGFYTCCCWTANEPLVIGGKAEILGGYKQNSEIKDQESTGRKRAASLYPITDGMVCEWAGLKYAGGGVRPVIGCRGSLIYSASGKGAIHHGPDKSTLNNGPENVHRICPTCHNRWHGLNDPLYGTRPTGGDPFIPTSGVVIAHDSETKATDLEWFTAEAQWHLRPEQRTIELGTIELGTITLEDEVVEDDV